MKRLYLKVLKHYLHKQFKDTRKRLGLTQAKMAEKLEIDTRSYSDIDNGKSLCSTLTFILFLLYYCPDLMKLLEEIRKILEDAKNSAA